MILGLSFLLLCVCGCVFYVFVFCLLCSVCVYWLALFRCFALCVFKLCVVYVACLSFVVVVVPVYVFGGCC